MARSRSEAAFAPRAALEGYLALGASTRGARHGSRRDPDPSASSHAPIPAWSSSPSTRKNGYVAIDGLDRDVGDHSPSISCAPSGDVPIGAVLYTDVARDGTGSGPNLEATGALAKSSPSPIIASVASARRPISPRLRRASRTSRHANASAERCYDSSLTLDDAIAAA